MIDKDTKLPAAESVEFLKDRIRILREALDNSRMWCRCDSRVVRCVCEAEDRNGEIDRVLKETEL